MPRHAHSPILALWNFTVASGCLMVLSAIILPLTGCSHEGQGGPNIASSSIPTDTHLSEGAQSGAPSPETAAHGQDPSGSITPPETEPIPEEVAEEASEVPVAGRDEEESPTIAATVAPTGATARLTWDPSPDPNVQGYFVHYGKQSPGESSACSYEESQRVTAPPATITGLEPNTVYFFAISAFGESESEVETPCSDEVLVVTPSTQG